MNELFKFAGNDYLGLASHPKVIEALCAAASRYGVSSTSSRWAQGWTPLHEALEAAVRQWMGGEDACIIGTAYMGGAIYYGQMAAMGKRVVFCDAMVHSNQFLGMRAAGMEIRTFRHLDVADLQRITSDYHGPPSVIATDGVFGISGEVADVSSLAQVASRIGAELFVDDAHGVGVLGERGRGSVELAGLEISGSTTVLGSMSKAIGAGGGFLAGRPEVIDRCRRSPEASGSAHPPAPIAGAALAGLEIITNDPLPRQRMQANAAAMRAMLVKAGITLADNRHPILGMLLESPAQAMALDRHFASHGLWIPYFKYASEPRENLLRAAARAVYTDQLLETFSQALLSRPSDHR